MTQSKKNLFQLISKKVSFNTRPADPLFLKYNPSTNRTSLIRIQKKKVNETG